YTGQRLAAVTRSGNQDARRRRSTAASSRLPESPRRDPPRPPKALAAILRSRVIACLRAQDGETAMQAAHAAVRGGVSVLEIVMSTPGVLEVVEDLRKSYPSLTFGVGTVLNADDARKAIRAGAQFLMSPGTVMVRVSTISFVIMFIIYLKFTCFRLLVIHITRDILCKVRQCHIFYIRDPYRLVI
uniref:KHG/KDPG aldolase n=1 Tax=Aegilops tauschii subsp. strangulata TaxID=200361 RepID=A0A453J7R0_AEGTS